jgi:hypothetical protein
MLKMVVIPILTGYTIAAVAFIAGLRWIGSD